MPSRQMSFREIRKSVKNDLSFLTKNLGMIKEKDEEDMLWKVDGIEYVLDKAEHLVKNAKKVCSSKFGMRISRIHC